MSIIMVTSQQRLKIFILAVLGLFVLICMKFIIVKQEDDTWICDKGKWVRYGNPTAPRPTSSCK